MIPTLFLLPMHIYLYCFYGDLQKNSAVAGAITGVALALTTNESSHEQIVQCAFTGAAMAATANLLSGIF